MVDHRPGSLLKERTSYCFLSIHSILTVGSSCRLVLYNQNPRGVVDVFTHSHSDILLTGGISFHGGKLLFGDSAVLILDTRLSEEQPRNLSTTLQVEVDQLVGRHGGWVSILVDQRWKRRGDLMITSEEIDRHDLTDLADAWRKH